MNNVIALTSALLKRWCMARRCCYGRRHQPRDREMLCCKLFFFCIISIHTINWGLFLKIYGLIHTNLKINQRINKTQNKGSQPWRQPRAHILHCNPMEQHRAPLCWRRGGVGKDTSLLQTSPRGDNFKSGRGAKAPFISSAERQAKFARSLFCCVIALCQFLARAICKLRISSPFCSPPVQMARLIRAVNRWGIIYLFLCQQRIIQAGQTGAIMSHFSFTQMNQSLASLVCEQQVAKQKQNWKNQIQIHSLWAKRLLYKTNIYMKLSFYLINKPCKQLCVYWNERMNHYRLALAG